MCIDKSYSDLAFFSDPCENYKRFTSSERIRTYATNATYASIHSYGGGDRSSVRSDKDNCGYTDDWQGSGWYRSVFFYEID